MNAALAQVGPRLRAARRARGLTLDDLATRAGMSASTLSRLESGKRQATLELLVPLTRHLGVRIDDLITADPPDPRISQSPIERDGLIIVPLSPDHAPVHTYKIIYPPAAGTPRPQAHDGYEWLYVLRGRLRLRLGPRELVLAHGEAAEFDTRTPHAVAAAGGRPAEIISIFNQAGARLHTRALDGSERR